MSFLFGGQPKMSSEQKIAAAETEVEMISDMFTRRVQGFTLDSTYPVVPSPFVCEGHVFTDAKARTSLTESCSKKCIPTDYREGDLNKGESVCLDRCVSKFFDVNIKVSEKMQQGAGQQGGGMGLSM
ncbi:Mitochondrial import inner membrane translocase subunit tim10 [Penicillium macrosclerotiorum]|uniref:Mitochondrial import inner membrane translocase subunit tim10 n=1 Tax=Penicillium macrosclerotiorum TaxID=303699 RepID=UPI0025499164|nr:Mitochondrial import inner membrane translocase subunit tim10 [Penicillium macrosclerotiorum]KAJ5679137.1 Mitochondrial import inner membrane translocase subunit tim10 [Penicillium macrosclerotiorum]